MVRLHITVRSGPFKKRTEKKGKIKENILSLQEDKSP